MTALTSLHQSIAADLRKVCEVFDDELFSDLPVINDLCAHVRQYRGKMLRPSLLLLAAKACGRIVPEHITLAAVVEMVHMATLVHDDVLDEADLRRRCPTINRFKGNEAAVLLGDYLISHAYHLCSSLDSQLAAQLISATTNMVCEGELQQIHHRDDLDLSLEQYLQIISRKTAALTSAACRLGAQFAGADETRVRNLAGYGLEAGIAFQIVDDVLDIVGTEERMGKTLGRDLDKHKPTLPVIHCLHHGDSRLRESVRHLLSNGSCDHSLLRETLESAGSIVYAMDMARGHVDRAIRCLDGLPATSARDTLVQMARLIIDRDQ